MSPLRRAPIQKKYNEPRPHCFHRIERGALYCLYCSLYDATVKNLSRRNCDCNCKNCFVRNATVVARTILPKLRRRLFLVLQGLCNCKKKYHRKNLLHRVRLSEKIQLSETCDYQTLRRCQNGVTTGSVQLRELCNCRKNTTAAV